MRIFFVNYASPGIHDPRATKLASSLAARGHEVTWIYHEIKGSYKNDKLRLVRISVPESFPFRMKEFLFAQKAGRWVVKNKNAFDAGIGSSHIGGYACYLAWKRTGLPYLFDYPDPLYPTDEHYASFYSPLDRWLARAFELLETGALRNAASIATISDYFKNYLVTRYSVEAKKVFIAYNSPDCSLFAPSEEKYREFTIGYVGKAIPEYGLDWLLKAFASLEDGKLLLVVKTEPKWKAWLDKTIRELNIGDRVILKENVPYEKVSAMLAKAHVAVFPYHPGKINDYAVPHKLFEYLALGLPVIARNLPAGKQILEENNAGIVVNDAQEFAAAVKKLRSRTLAAALSKNARKVAVQKYDWRQMILLYERALKE